MGFFDKIKAVADPHQGAVRRPLRRGRRAAPTRPTQRSRPIDVDTLEALEEALISADVGVAATERIVEAVRSTAVARRVAARAGQGGDPRRSCAAPTTPAPNGQSPHVVLIVGVNGTGKTTTVGKLARLIKDSGKTPLDLRRRHVPRRGGRAAGDLGEPRRRRHHPRAGPAPIRRRSCSTRIAAGKARGRDVVLVDTAGRLHTRVNLMTELDKIRRVAAREVDGAPHEVLLVLDATVGQNGLAQAREFMAVAGVNGIVLTKLDGTAKGGIAVAIAHDLKLPIRYVGVGEGIDDLIPFSPEEYVDALFEEKW